MTSYLFVYGTLQPGIAAAMGEQERNRLMVSGTFLGPGIARGALLDFGTYPGMVPADGPVHGGVYDLQDAAATFVWLDAYEGLSGSPGDEYQRRAVPVELASGETILAWAYVFVREQADWPIVPSGRWRPRQP